MIERSVKGQMRKMKCPRNVQQSEQKKCERAKQYGAHKCLLQTHEVIEVCAKILYQVELCRENLEIMWGFSVEAELVENSERQDELCCYVSRVEERSVAIQNGKCSILYN